jgi:hypothetical protein
MSVQAANDIRELTANEIDLAAGAVNPWIVRIAAKLIIAAGDYIAENGLPSGGGKYEKDNIGNKI